MWVAALQRGGGDEAQMWLQFDQRRGIARLVQFVGNCTHHLFNHGLRGGVGATALNKAGDQAVDGAGLGGRFQQANRVQAA